MRCDAWVVDLQKFRIRFGFGVAAQLYVRLNPVLTEHIVYSSLSTSFTPDSGMMTPKGVEDALEREDDCAGEAELHHVVDGRGHKCSGVVQDFRDLADAGLQVHSSLSEGWNEGPGGTLACSPPSVEQDLCMC